MAQVLVENAPRLSLLVTAEKAEEICMRTSMFLIVFVASVFSAKYKRIQISVAE